jgi:Putative addiction module component
MSKKGAEILEMALSLPAAERAELADHLLSSLDAVLANEKLWAKESEDRLDAYERGEIKAVPAPRDLHGTRSKKL